MSAPATDMRADMRHLWYLGDPSRPAHVGTLRLVLDGRGVSLRYAPTWIGKGFALSEDLPLIDAEHLPAEKDRAAGALDDARPDRWGERVIRLVERPARLSILEMLWFAGDARFGALGVSASAGRYEPAPRGALATIADADALHALVRRVIAGERVDEANRRLIAPGASMGGARPKALLAMDGVQWVLKFAEDDRPEEPLLEHAAMTLARRAGIGAAETRLVPLAHGAAVAVRRFDRTKNSRVHALSAAVALRAAGAECSYPELAQLLRRRASVAGGAHRAQMRELFRRAVFNVLIDNSDDHEKNHVLLAESGGTLRLAPAFDVLPTGHALGYQSMPLGERGAESSVANALSAAGAFWLSRREALAEARGIARAVNRWQRHFAARGVPARAIEALAACLDRPALREERRRLARERGTR